MTSMTKRGRKLNSTPSVKKEHEEAMPEIPGNLSTVYSGYYVQERLGGTCRKRMGTGRMYTAGSAVSLIKGSGKRFWKPWWTMQTLSG
jgi:hypothetical protein